MRLLSPLLLSCVLVSGSVPLGAQDWPQWRGPAFNGSSPAKGLPSLGAGTELVRWRTPLPGFSGATPAVVGDRLFVTSPNADKDLLLMCLSTKDGAVLWQRQLATGDLTRGNRAPNMCSPSPVTDGKRVFALFGTGEIAALDLEGNLKWTRNLAEEFGRFALMWLYGSSPLLHEGKLYVQVLQRTPVPPDYTHAVDGKPERESYVLCMDAESGKTVWRVVRPTEARMESMESYGTPVPLEFGGRRELLILGGDCVTGHSFETGEELWRAGGFNPKKDDWMRIVSSPVVFEDLVIASGPKRQPVIAVRSGGRGEVTDTHTVWKFEEFPPDVCTPAVSGGRVFVLDGDRQMLTALEGRTGAQVWQVSLGIRENFKASPTVADGRVFCVSERGSLLSVDAETGALGPVVELGGGSPTRSSVVVAGGAIFVRTAEELICLRK